MKTIIKNGLIVDGTGRKGYQADILIDGGYIKKIGANLEYEGAKEIDIRGNVVCPGFIDTHSHSDLNLFVNPSLLPKISQGITTEVLGQDGISTAPVTENFKKIWAKNVSGLLGETGHPWQWETVEEFMREIEKAKTANNMLYLAPHGNIRMVAMGLEAKKASPEEIQNMQQILELCLDNGCAGMSTGLIYPPCTYADKEELTALCQVLAKKDKLLVIHQRSEADDIINSTREVIELGHQTGVKIHFSHFKLAGKNNWHLLEELMSLLDEAREQGIDISFDQYPYTAGSTMLAVILPPWVHSGGTEKLIERLKDLSQRGRIKEDIKKGIPGWDNFIEFAGYDGIYITDTLNDKSAIGMNLQQLGEKYNCHPLDAAFDLLISEENKVSMVDFYGNEESLIRFMKDSRQNFCTDGLLGGKPHPRVYGAYTRVLSKYVREEKIFTLEEAIKKMTSVPAQRFNIAQRGQVKEGFFADLIIFNPATVKDRATYENPAQLSDGIDYILVNGEVVYKKGKLTGLYSGQVLTNKSK